MYNILNTTGSVKKELKLNTHYIDNKLYVKVGHLNDIKSIRC